MEALNTKKKQKIREEFYCKSHDGIRYKVIYKNRQFIFETDSEKEEVYETLKKYRENANIFMKANDYEFVFGTYDPEMYKKGKKTVYGFNREKDDGDEVWYDNIDWSDDSIVIKWETKEYKERIKELVKQHKNEEEKDKKEKEIKKLEKEIEKLKKEIEKLKN